MTERKTKGEKYQRVLALLKAKGRLAMNDPELLALLSRDEKQKSNLVYRMTTYVSYIRRFAGLEVKALRNGRVAWAYELIPTGVDEVGNMTYQASKYAKLASVPESPAPAEAPVEVQG